MKGRCLCGAVEFTVSGALSKLYQCHCSLCRRVSGSSSNAAMIVPMAHFAWQQGQGLIRQYCTETGFKSHFCSQCGSPVPNMTRDNESYWIPAGLLDDPADTQVAMHVYTASKASWDGLLEETSPPSYEAMPPDGEFMTLLHPDKNLIERKK
ncbi:Glutathione-dependent formaldehyde-activating enzyme [Marinomonas spartinae]|uniref:GFA family protein n=1 Tax=Marinomonas spartinae TaxID=1792290 RepID=UPI0008090679|nr:GFA family protein [Marinomonas spartinae]SBS38367.1 Glutathione-dependent formaldehyde-activating enzyme [Marinomonas spartinae]